MWVIFGSCPFSQPHISLSLSLPPSVACLSLALPQILEKAVDPSVLWGLAWGEKPLHGPFHLEICQAHTQSFSQTQGRKDVCDNMWRNLYHAERLNLRARKVCVGARQAVSQSVQLILTDGQQ